MQFSTSEALVVTGIVSVCTAALLAVPDWICSAFVLGATPIMTAALLTSLYGSEGRLRAFFFGALAPTIPALVIWLQVMWSVCCVAVNHSLALAATLEVLAPDCRRVTAGWLVLAILSGCTCTLLHRGK